jgi:alginate O-acetyltransferase complex protein AlgI
MPFNSISFAAFLLIFIITYYLTPSRLRNILILAGSWFFYSFGSLINLSYLIIVTLITYYTVKRTSPNKNYIIPYTSISVVIVLLIILYSKYINIFIKDDLNEWVIINDYKLFIQPIGISFYSLQALSLMIDSKRLDSKKFTFMKIALFLSFFPQSIAGPIHRWEELGNQFDVPKQLNQKNIIIGLKYLICGFFLKLILADKIAFIINPVLNNYKDFNGILVFLSSILFSFQIYYDFFGYSLIAIGLGQLLGFEINRNFNNPYKASSFKEFWHRWHISLSQWFRDYVYLPLGGRSKYYNTFLISIAITFILSGYWHGATSNFLLWGIVHALLYLLEDIVNRLNYFRNKTTGFFSKKPYLILKKYNFFIIISMTWLIFRANSLEQLAGQFSKILFISSWSISDLNYFLEIPKLTFITILLISLSVKTDKMYQLIQHVPIKKSEFRFKESMVICICILLIILFGDINQQQFLYFKF